MKTYNLLLVFLIALIPYTSNATHLKGGEIGWNCLPNGQYQFYLNIYIDCPSSPINLYSQTLDVSNAPINSITLKPDTARYASINYGNYAYSNAAGMKANCPSSSPNSYLSTMLLPFISDPITLTGVPPSNGWIFSWNGSPSIGACCRTNLVNIFNSTGKSYFLRAIMYPYQNRSADTCYDSSPKFADFPHAFFESETEYSFSQAASDMDLDSLNYEFGTSLSNNFYDPVSWTPGYNSSSPFPNSSHHPQNIEAQINNINGHVNGYIVNPNGGFESYGYAIRVDAFRKGEKIASIWRDTQLFSIQADTLNTASINKKPELYMNGQKKDTLKISVNVGDKISIPVMAVDSNLVFDDPTDTSTLRNQDVMLLANGLLFSNDYNDSSYCALSSISSCATLTPAPTYNPSTQQMELVNTTSVSTLFEWQPSCDLLHPWENQKYFNFVFAAADDHMPQSDFVKLNFSTLTVEVNRAIPELVQNGNTLTVLDSGSTYQWFLNDSLLQNATTNRITMNAQGIYSVLVDNNVCDFQKAYFDNTTVSLETENMLKKIKIYPNPTKDNFYVELPTDIVGNLEFTIKDINGRNVELPYVQQQNSISIESGELASGIYFLVIVNQEKQVNYKLVKL